ncbi:MULTISPECIES: hypothetical protein [Gammaproteobacteria]|nr:MAG: hypothetical protein KFB92_06840 [Alcanivorax sp.]
MSMEMMKKVTIGAVGAAFILSAASAQAARSPANNPNVWDTIQTNGTAPFTFEGTSNLSQYGIPVNGCLLTLTGDVTILGSGDLEVEVTSGSVTAQSGSSSLCGSVTLSGFPWVATVPASDSQADADALDDVQGTFTGVSVYGLGSCGGDGTVDAVFNNNGATVSNSNPSYFQFNDSIGNCTIDGTVYVVDEDVDAY